MDRIIEVKVGGNYLSKDCKTAGVKGEANVTNLRITFDEGWDGYAKKVTFWDARGLNPVRISLLPHSAENDRVYLVPIPAEPMAEAGMMTFVIDGTTDDKVQRSLSDKLEVKDAPIAEGGQPVPPAEDDLTQIQGEIEKIKSDILDAREAKGYSDQALIAMNIAKESADKAQASVGKTSYIGDNGNWYAWDLTLGEFYDTGVKAQAGSMVWLGANPPEEADVWIDPDGNGGVDITTLEELLNEVSYAKYTAEDALAQTGSNSTGIEWLTGQVGDLNSQYDSLNSKVSEAHAQANSNYQYINEMMSTHASDIEGIRKDINEESHFRGYFIFNALLRTSKATPNDFAYSAESGTKWIYDAQSGWVKTDIPVPDQLTPASLSTPLMNGTASVGTENGYARGDHRHPTDITRASVAEVNEIRNQIGDIATLLGGI